MKYKAVIFDLGSTLYPETSKTSRTKTVSGIAEALSVSPVTFAPLWNRYFEKQMHGGLMTCPEYIEYICRLIGVSVSSTQITNGAQVFFDSIEMLLDGPRPETREVLASIITSGLKNGLVSNAASYIADVWETSPLARFFDSVVFSCSVGLRKPDPRIYLLATDKMSVLPQECLYVADGKYDELSGASKVGMSAIQLRAPGENDNDADRQRWDGSIISSLKEVVSFLE